MLNRLNIGNKIGASFALGLIVFAVQAAVSYQATNQLISTSRQESHTYQVIGDLKELASLIKDAETGQRGYIITGKKRYLDPYNDALKVVDQKVKNLRRMTQDNPNQQRRLDVLDRLLGDKLAELKETIALRQQQGFEAAQKVVLTDRGKTTMEGIRRVIANLEAEESYLLQQRSGTAEAAARRTIDSITYSIPIYSVFLTLIGFSLVRNISKPLRQVSAVTDKIALGDLSVSVPTSDRQDEIGVLTKTFNQMIDSLRETTQKNDEQNWLKSNLAEFSRLLQGQRNLETVARIILSELAPQVGAQQGLFYLMDSLADPPLLKLLSSYAYQERKHLANQFRIGEGLVGQCALEKQKILLTEVPSDYIRISSGLGEAPPLNIIVLPVLFETQVSAVIELASFQRFSNIHLTFLDQVSEGIGVVLSTIAAATRTAQLLEQSQALTEELQSQQEELKESNRLLEEQTEALQTSEALLKEQQQELQDTNGELEQLNEELEEKAELLSMQKREVERQNQEIEQTRQALEQKAEQLALSSKYKSEFLANMSHELRTPLNSLLILARLLRDNNEGNLTAKQVEYSQTIFSSGTDLLNLINDILDLAKIESGKISLNIEEMFLSELQINLEQTFRQVAQEKGLDFRIEIDSNLPQAITTDPQRLQQVLKNLLANAFKFTERGGVTLQITATADHLHPNEPPDLATPTSLQPWGEIAFAVTDTGIGIAADQQKIIFEAFQQADGTTSRKYEGTGLGLSISRELAQLLEGRIELVTQLGQGSTFTLYLPLEVRVRTQPIPLTKEPLQEEQSPRKLRTQSLSKPLSSLQTRDLSSISPLAEIPDDRETIQPGDRVLLIIEDDINFARILLEIARQQSFKVLVALRGNLGLTMARELSPAAIMLDIRLPDMDGWMVLDSLKNDPNTRHIPVHILSIDEEQQRGLQLGAITFLQKPISLEALTQVLAEIKDFIDRQVKYLLVVEDDPVQARSIIELIGNNDLHTTSVGTAAEALSLLRSRHFDCIVMDLGLPDMSGFELIEQIKLEASLAIPIIVYTGKELTRQEETRLKRLAQTIIVKDVRSPERLLDEIALFLQRVQANLPQPKRQILEQLHQMDPVLAHKSVLIIEDDVRNTFALTSLLERYQMRVLYAENGTEGITKLQNHPDVDLILMDVMMPEMDGYETTRAIREQEQFRSLPIIALTAKAMQGEREKCLEAGASDYITKPVNTEQLLSLLRVWLYRK